ncbi:DASH family cryptochrome [Exiguobacterium sp. KRL4]|uniref:DASH family cryptochrome n=1 Tax=Exiguobacterium sp. KRL4 TaxID=1914536 RepID=UPI0008F89620|nr:DASH family cryptochrome [Exiguobacterium sp. KRL4]OIN66387.1 DASH family cryptochrome [Exiguobacterium sp. KRL4]
MAGIVWYRNDLRVDDHQALSRACTEQETVRALFIQRETETRGHQHVTFERETLESLRDHLGQLGIELTILRGETMEQLSRFIEPEDVVYFHRMTGFYEERLEQAVLRQFTACMYETQTLHLREDIGSDELKRVFTAFRKRVEESGRFAEPIEAPGEVRYVEPPEARAVDHPHTAFPFAGGEAAGRARLTEYLERPVFTYKETRNGFDRDDSSKLSAWLANGSLSPRRVMAELQRTERLHGANESTYWLYFELLWRDFFHLTMRETGHRLFRSNGLRDGHLTWETDQSAIDAWMAGRTGQPFVDAFMREIRETGWMSNRGRQITASYLIHDLKQDWRIGARYFEQQLIDYDVASNYGNWAYIAGVGNATRIPRFNPEFQQQKYDPAGAFIRRWMSSETTEK